MLIDLGPMAEGTKLSNLVIGTRDTLSTLYLGEVGTTAKKNIEVFEHFVLHLSGLTPFPNRFFIRFQEAHAPYLQYRMHPSVLCACVATAVHACVLVRLKALEPTQPL